MKKRCAYCGSAKHILKKCPLNPPKDFLAILGGGYQPYHDSREPLPPPKEE